MRGAARKPSRPFVTRDQECFSLITYRRINSARRVTPAGNRLSRPGALSFVKRSAIKPFVEPRIVAWSPLTRVPTCRRDGHLPGLVIPAVSQRAGPVSATERMPVRAIASGGAEDESVVEVVANHYVLLDVPVSERALSRVRKEFATTSAPEPDGVAFSLFFTQLTATASIAPRRQI